MGFGEAVTKAEMSVIGQEDAKGNSHRDGHDDEGPSYPCGVVDGQEPGFWDVVKGYGNC